MKKTLIVLSLITSFAFANEQIIQVSQIQTTGCVEKELTYETSMISCPSAQYIATFTVEYGKRVLTEKAIIEKVSELKSIIIQQIGNK